MRARRAAAKAEAGSESKNNCSSTRQPGPWRGTGGGDKATSHPPTPQLPALPVSASALFLICVTPLASTPPLLARACARHTRRNRLRPRPAAQAGKEEKIPRSAACSSSRTGGDHSFFALLEFSVFFAALRSGYARRTDRFLPFLFREGSIKDGCLQLRLV